MLVDFGNIILIIKKLTNIKILNYVRTRRTRKLNKALYTRVLE